MDKTIYLLTQKKEIQSVGAAGVGTWAHYLLPEVKMILWNNCFVYCEGVSLWLALERAE